MQCSLWRMVFLSFQNHMPYINIYIIAGDARLGEMDVIYVKGCKTMMQTRDCLAESKWSHNAYLPEESPSHPFNTHPYTHSLILPSWLWPHSISVMWLTFFLFIPHASLIKSLVRGASWSNFLQDQNIAKICGSLITQVIKRWTVMWLAHIDHLSKMVNVWMVSRVAADD